MLMHGYFQLMHNIIIMDMDYEFPFGEDEKATNWTVCMIFIIVVTSLITMGSYHKLWGKTMKLWW